MLGGHWLGWEIAYEWDAETGCEDDAEAGDCGVQVGVQPGEEVEGRAEGMCPMEGFSSASTNSLL